uniref:CDP-diacylglycerol--glycerol-3-phosphate 3-phosphatidyltransferase n=1 Tax=Clytia hemisphaerica TaxID=252671 RepID=A0A7M5UPC5_9CNID
MIINRKIAMSFGIICSMKSISKFAGVRYFAATTTNHGTSWSQKWFKNVQLKSPVFYCDANDIEVMKDPHEFYNSLKELSSNAKERITLASLYLGNGKLEKDLVDIIYKTMDNASQPIKCNVLLEYTRGSRGSNNSRTMLLPIVNKFTKDTNVALFHTPNLRGLLRKIVPERFNETINVSHLKVYLFDDTLIISGANLSNDYFTNRQDRYIMFKNNKQLCDYFDDLVQTISQFSFQLTPHDTVKMKDNFPFHPYKSRKKDFNKAAERLLKDFILKYSTRREIFDGNCVERLTCTAGTELPKDQHSTLKKNNKDTLIFPLLQMKTMGIDQDEEVTSNIISFAPPPSQLVLATAYFNLTDRYWDAVCENDSENRLIMAHPKAMGFYKAPGMAGGIPNAYSLIALRRYRQLQNNRQTDKTKFYEFHHPGWTFHGKGLWGILSDVKNAPIVTLIGSPNFGKRSVYRDMEAQVAIVTVNKQLKEDLIEERDSFFENTTLVSRQTFNDKERAPSWWVWDKDAPIQLSLTQAPKQLPIQNNATLHISAGVQIKNYTVPRNIRVEVDVSKKILFWVKIPCFGWYV